MTRPDMDRGKPTEDDRDRREPTMADEENPLSRFRDELSQLAGDGERLLQDPSLGLDERAILQRVNGYLLEARAALGELTTPSA